MRFTVTIVLLAAMFLTSCAYQGVVVEKHSRPHPLYHSIGIEGVYTFVLRDQSGALHRQMVSPEVFEMYAEGDYFDDRQAGPTRASDAKQTRTAMQSVAKTAQRTTRTSRRKPVTKPKALTAKAQPKRGGSKTVKSTATRTPSRSSAAKARQAQRTERKASTTKTAKRSTNGNQRPVAKKEPKPWKMTEPTVETDPVPANPAPPAEGPATPSAEVSPVSSAPTAAKPGSVEEADAVSTPQPPR